MAAEVGEIARMLARRAPELARTLLRDGVVQGDEWVQLSRAQGGLGDSFKVRIGGARAGVWSHFAEGVGGDALDLVAYVLYGGDKGQAIAWARNWLGLSTAAAPESRPVAAAPPPPDDEATRHAEEAERRKIALKIFLAAEISLKGTPAAAYLAGRGIDLAALGRQPRSLRFHPHLFNRESGDHWPALVAAITNDAGAHVATHRTWLALRDGSWGKAPLRDAKMSIGMLRGGCIRLWRGASGKPLKDVVEGERVAIAEGIETALSVAIACPELRVLCAVSIANMANLALPAAVAGVILCADNDQGNEAAARALRRAGQRYQGEGRTVQVAMPAAAGADWNDVLQAETGHE